MIRKIYNFLGSIYFAVTLISTAALFVIVGTFIESHTDSHLYAATFTYKNPVFIGLLWCFFINILVSALRRWPFKWRHVPFLTTHIGLLMILSGCLIKSYFGTQGIMIVVEGSSSNRLLLPNSHVVRMDKKGSDGFREFSLKGETTPFPELDIKVVDYCSNSCERLESWIKKDHVFIAGLRPFPVGETVRTELFPYETWKSIAYRTDDIIEEATKRYFEGLEVILTDKLTGNTIYQGPVEASQVHFNYSTVQGFDQPQLIVDDVSVDLTTLQNRNLRTPDLGNGTMRVELHREPKLVFLQDPHNDIHLFAFGPHGDVQAESFNHDTLSTLIVYDQGYHGYGVNATIKQVKSFKEQETLKREILRKQLKIGVADLPTLSPPLRLFYEACQKAKLDFADTSLDFLTAWDNSNSWLYPHDAPLSPRIAEVISHIDWATVPNNVRKGCYWSSNFFKDIEPALKRGDDPKQLLKEIGCPITDEEDLLTLVTQQIFAAGDELPIIGEENSVRLLTAYLRAYGIHLKNIQPEIPNEGEIAMLEAPITLRHRKIPPRSKLEDNLPKVTLQLKRGNQVDYVTLTYNRTGSGLKWPALNGEYLLRFQPKTKRIPYRVRLRNARQINYANSPQAYSYESDLIVTDTKTGMVTEKTISMNNVYETWEGYRFYLSNISLPSETAVKRIQLAVNHDPAKYLLTYPGGFIVALGIILLFWKKGRHH